jgi:FMN phosphatase YigB (HAD superfamily)
MTIIWDLDYTLLDTVAFKKALKEAVTALGVSPERYEQTYAEVVKREGKTYDYDPAAHVEALRSDLGGDDGRMAEALSRIDAVLARTEEFLYPGSVEMLRRYQDAGARQVLLTLGNERWQEAKVSHSGLAALFDEVRAVGKGKADALREIAAREERVYVVNDNGEEMRAMMEEAATWRGEDVPELRFILKKGPKPVPEGLDLPQAELDEIEKLLDEELGIDRRDHREGRPLRT